MPRGVFLIPLDFARAYALRYFLAFGDFFAGLAGALSFSGSAAACRRKVSAARQDAPRKGFKSAPQAGGKGVRNEKNSCREIKNFPGKQITRDGRAPSALGDAAASVFMFMPFISTCAYVLRATSIDAFAPRQPQTIKAILSNGICILAFFASFVRRVRHTPIETRILRFMRIGV